MFRTAGFLFVIVAFVRSEPRVSTKESDSFKELVVQEKTSVGVLTFVGDSNLRCYTCTDCQKVSYDTNIKTCPYNADGVKNKCVVYTEIYKHLDKPWVVRGCTSDRGNCEEIRKVHEENGGEMVLSSCNECDGEKCNGVSRSLPVAFLTLVVTPILAKYVLF